MKFPHFFLLAFAVLSCMNAWSQGSKKPVKHKGAGVTDSPEVFKYVEEVATFPGNVSQWLGERLNYPEFAQFNGITGMTSIQFLIDEYGHVTNAEVLKSSYPILDQEALRVVRDMPLWEPGKNNGKPVKSYFTLPIVFALEPGNRAPADALDTCMRTFSTNRHTLFRHFPEYSGSYDELQQVRIPLNKDEVAVTVYIAVTISKKGEITLPYVLCSLNDAFVNNVLAAFKSSMVIQNRSKRWKPARNNKGAVTDCVMVIPVNAVTE